MAGALVSQPGAAAARSSPRHGQRSRVRAPKAGSAAECLALEQLPNIGPSMAADLRLLGIARPADLAQRDAFSLYQALCSLSGKRQDPCVLDTFMAATDFMRGAAPAPWWAYTAERKRLYGSL
ncbi:helix-hairpin-helix domain-containing protein [Aquabacterium sp. OR-4]|uniref:helix-hairpin-helix domain-containing protein n=1 Tax=Aquabacterium sp. OR-4 TaxID=2978127 RepID=UPI0021B22A18|nr:helix-hairpin-helix domain-containing protein [Aquabacterium sp. OR-4]MDT7834902.1 helix-hairpin-helix domain-containing protein [Aquabacterium sp. OR-4]